MPQHSAGMVTCGANEILEGFYQERSVILKSYAAARCWYTSTEA